VAKKTCLIVGAGIAGLAAANQLRRNGWAPLVLDKGRGPGGRMATRQRGTTRFDHGAQFFTVRHARFKSVVDDWISRGVVKPWFGDERRTRYCGIRAWLPLPGLSPHPWTPGLIRLLGRW
jgi:predicted NAD/FAD-dependent oxidoreductase